MERSTIIGIVLGLTALIGGMFFKHAPITALVNPAAFLIIIVGTAASLFVGFPMSDLKKFPKLIKLIFKKQELLPKKQLIAMFIEWVTITRREGLLALESKVDDIQDPFLRNGMRMIIDGNDQEFIHDVLMEEINAMEERHRSGAQIFSQAGMYAPTLGVLGAVVGLIAALGNLSDINALGQSIAAAFVATLLGIFTGYVLWHPIANKLKQLSKKEVEIKLMMVEGLLSIQSGISAIAIEQKLAVFLSPTERYAEDAENEEETSREAKAQAAS
ncbi:flagellar motor stator protein MotA [Paenibacillus thermoaerophilus]|jgi:chemotaxis protein MotA|uniref:Flagellar motor stator protein MotA n=1 Tax=Paenibacillus thermoaerophilus TaxID=1215385 RepID=A0ABW2V039_9BACL|nr:flagellar motor stator protein MotA [Paenibacillus thermoaerophilus]TMV18220.1 flagellar motor stator protein MotA [Paenibacillus thermoaerophilus]